MENSLLYERIRAKYWGTAGLDPRCKLLLLICTGFASYFISSDLASFLLVVGLGVLISFGNKFALAIKAVIFFILIACLNAAMRYVSIPVVSMFISVFGVTILKMIPIFMMAKWLLDTTPIDGLMVSLERMKLPQSLTISLVVMFRYIPTLRIEYKIIKDVMKLRGIGNTVAKKVLHPMGTIEFILIPLLMRCIKVSDELAASGATRGLELRRKRYAIHSIYFSVKDYLVAIFAIAFFVILFILGKTTFKEIILWRI